MSQDVHIRQTVKFTDYKQFGTTTKIIYNGEEISNKPEDAKPDGAKPDGTKPPETQKPK
jgi:hypothetical protein